MTINIVDTAEYAEYGQLVIELSISQMDTVSLTGIEKLGSVFCGYTECLYRLDDKRLYELLKAWSQVDEYRDCVFVFSAKGPDTDRCMEVSICRDHQTLKQIVIADSNGMACTVLPVKM